MPTVRDFVTWVVNPARMECFNQHRFIIFQLVNRSRSSLAPLGLGLYRERPLRIANANFVHLATIKISTVLIWRVLLTLSHPVVPISDLCREGHQLTLDAFLVKMDSSFLRLRINLLRAIALRIYVALGASWAKLCWAQILLTKHAPLVCKGHMVPTWQCSTVSTVLAKPICLIQTIKKHSKSTRHLIHLDVASCISRTNITCPPGFLRRTGNKTHDFECIPCSDL